MGRVAWGSRFNRENIRESESENGIMVRGWDKGSPFASVRLKGGVHCIGGLFL